MDKLQKQIYQLEKEKKQTKKQIKILKEKQYEYKRNIRKLKLKKLILDILDNQQSFYLISAEFYDLMFMKIFKYNRSNGVRLIYGDLDFYEKYEDDDDSIIEYSNKTIKYEFIDYPVYKIYGDREEYIKLYKIEHEIIEKIQIDLGKKVFLDPRDKYYNITPFYYNCKKSREAIWLDKYMYYMQIHEIYWFLLCMKTKNIYLCYELLQQLYIYI